jgi:hypothetical protein
MTEQDVRWLQRFSNFKKALNQLDSAVQLSEERELSDLEKQGLIQAFEETAQEILKNILQVYHPLFVALQTRMYEEARKHDLA